MSSKLSARVSGWAQLRFSIIGGLLASPPEHGELRQRIAELAAKTYCHPTKPEERLTFGASTIERWYYQAIKSDNPIDAVERKIRSDLGQTYAMSSVLLTELGKQYKEHPGWSYKLHADNLVALVKKQPELGEAPSYSTVVRRMKRHGWRKQPRLRNRPSHGVTAGQQQAQDRLENREVRSYESPFVHGLWHLDFHNGSLRVVDSNGTWHTPKAMCVLDDYSRLCCHIQWYLTETAENLIHALCQAFQKRGLPRSLMTDNGAAMLAGETKNGLQHLSVKHETTLPYSPDQNGKQESFWGTLEGRLCAMIENVYPLTLEFLNQVTQAWVEQGYNRDTHTETGVSPLDRLLDGHNIARPSPSSNQLRLSFCIQENRTQRRSDGTLTIKGIRFEVPSRFRHLDQLVVRFQSWDLSMAYLMDPRTGVMLSHIYPLDKTSNASRGRKALDPLDGAMEIPQSGIETVRPDEYDKLPPLLREQLSNFAATGMPAPYIPKDEHLTVESPNE